MAAGLPTAPLRKSKSIGGDRGLSRACGGERWCSSLKEWSRLRRRHLPARCLARGAARRDRHADRRQWRRQEHDPRTVSGLLAPRAEGSSSSTDGRLPDCSPDAIVALGLVQVPEGRRVFPELSVEENLRVGGLSGRQAGQGSRDARPTSMRAFRAGGKAKAARGYALRRRTADACLRSGNDGAPKLLLLDEPSLGLARAW